MLPPVTQEPQATYVLGDSRLSYLLADSSSTLGPQQDLSAELGVEKTAFEEVAEVGSIAAPLDLDPSTDAQPPAQFTQHRGETESPSSSIIAVIGEPTIDLPDVFIQYETDGGIRIAGGRPGEAERTGNVERAEGRARSRPPEWTVTLPPPYLSIIEALK